MRLIRFEDEAGDVRFGREIQPPTDGGPGRAEPLKGSMFGGMWTGDEVAVRRLLCPLEPTNIICVGANYAEHVRESGLPIPEKPVLFMKPTTTAIGTGDDIRLPKVCVQEVDYECELAVVIGKQGRDIPKDKALDHVFGYTAANDVSARKWQKEGGGGQWVRGKSFDTFCPLGPAIITPGSSEQDIADPQALQLSTTLNGQVMQQHTTGDMIFSVADLIAFISCDTTLLPGTVILTGTPQGVGFARKPPVWLKAGDEVVVEIDKIGRLSNRVVAG